MKQLIVGSIVCAIFAASGCYRHEYSRPGAQAQNTAAYSEWHHHLLWGLIDASGAVDLDSVCPTGVADIKNEVSFVNGLLTLFTGYLYQPTTVEVYCVASAQAFNVTIQPDEAMVARMREQYPNVEQDLRRAMQAFEAEEALDVRGSSYARGNTIRGAL